MNILQVSCEGLGNGGVQKIIMEITRNLASENNIDIVLFTKEKRHYDDEFLNYGEIYRICDSKKNRILRALNYYIRGPKIFCGMMKILKNKKYDVIHCHNDYESAICLLAARLSGVKVRISHLHRADYNEKGNILNTIYNSFLKRVLLSSATNIICCSEMCKKSFFNKVKSKQSKKVSILLNCIDMSRFKTRLEAKKVKDNYKLAHIGRFCANKNQIFILHILKELINKGKKAKLSLVGFDEEYKNIIIVKAKELEIYEYLEILPADTDIPEFLAGIDLFVFPSLKEGLGIVLLEAQAAGVPCLASDTVPTEANFGLVKYMSLKNNQVSEWAEAVISVCSQEEDLRLNFNALKQLDISAYIQNIKQIYTQNCK